MATCGNALPMGKGFSHEDLLIYNLVKDALGRPLISRRISRLGDTAYAWVTLAVAGGQSGERGATSQPAGH